MTATISEHDTRAGQETIRGERAARTVRAIGTVLGTRPELRELLATADVLDAGVRMSV